MVMMMMVCVVMLIYQYYDQKSVCTCIKPCRLCTIIYSYGLYMKSRGTLDLDEPERPVIDSVKDALEVLEDACIAQGVGIRMDMVSAALRAIHIDTLSGDEGVGPARYIPSTPIEELDGRWRLRITSYQEAVEFVTKAEIWYVCMLCIL